MIYKLNDLGSLGYIRTEGLDHNVQPSHWTNRFPSLECLGEKRDFIDVDRFEAR